MNRPEPKPSHWASFLQVLDTVPAGDHVSSNILRDLLAAADIPEKSRGGLFAQAAKLGHLRPVAHRYEASTGETANRAVVRIYRKASTQQRSAA
jgi:hypothetical protein